MIDSKAALYCSLSLSENFGPLIHAWTMRQESKLSFIKHVSHQSNFKNVCKTAARKHQFWFCSKLVSLPHLLLSNLEMSPKGHTSCLENELDYVQAEFLCLIPSLTPETTVRHPKWPGWNYKAQTLWWVYLFISSLTQFTLFLGKCLTLP